MRIGDRVIGHSQPVYLIAEIGSNHNGDIMQAFELIDAAANTGADAAKFQLFNPDTLYPGKHTPGSIDADWLPDLRSRCDYVGVDFLCSVFDISTLHAYAAFNPVAVKIASPEAVNEQLLYAASSMPMLVSTGALDWDATDRVNSVLRAHQAEYALLHCVSAYPAPLAELNLGVITQMVRGYDCPIGFSDHYDAANSPTIASFAVMAGASILEKHFTLDRRQSGPDHAFAAEPSQFAGYVRAARLAERWRGDGVKRVMPSEDATDRRAAA